MRNYKLIILIFLFGSQAGLLHAQAPVTKIGFKIQSYRDDKKVILRWLLDDARQWRFANDKGFIIERAESGSNKFVRLNKEIIKPLSDQAEVKKLDTAGNIYQALGIIYSEPQPAQGNQHPDDDMYAMYFMMSSYETQAAVLTASAYVDLSVEKGKQYTYRITVANTKIPQSDNTYEQTADNTPMPAGPDLKTVFSNRKVTHQWDIKYTEASYFATVIEQSRDSVNFAPVGSPLIKVHSEADLPENKTKMQTEDTITNKIKYYYRLRGLNIFGVTGEPGNTESGIGGPDLDMAPQINEVDSLYKDQIVISWVLPDSLYDVVQKYEIYQSKKVDTNYIKIGEVGGSPVIKKEFTATVKNPSTYFIVKAIGVREGQETVSAPYFYQLIDSIPPAIPVELSGKSDSTGVITLQWKQNTEPDFFGYRVLRAQKKGDEFVLLNGEPSRTNIYRDTLPMNQLNTVMYYRIAAVDNRYNESKASAVIEVRRPDRIPPAPPRMDIVKAQEKQLYVQWIPSFSKDVAAYHLFRKQSNDSVPLFKQIFSAKNTDTSFVDKDVQPGITYYYAVEAIDSGSLLSPRSAAISGIITKSDDIKKGVKGITTYVSRLNKYIELSWSNNESDAESYWVYRLAPGEELTLVSMLPAAKRRFVDEDVKPSSLYKYAIKVVYKDGRSSKMERVEVAY